MRDLPQSRMKWIVVIGEADDPAYKIIHLIIDDGGSPMIFDYHLVSAAGPGALEDEVKRYIADGWQPVNHTFTYSSGQILCQQMVKYQTAELKECCGGECGCHAEPE